MKTLLHVFSVVLVLFLVVIITGLFLPRQIQLVAKKDIPASPVIVFEQLNDLQNWSYWMPWVRNDSNLVIEYGESHIGKQSSMKWERKDNNQLKCETVLTHSVFPESIAANFDFDNRIKTTGLWYVDLNSTGCEVNWTLNLKKLGLYERFIVQMEKNAIRDQLSEGLDLLSERALDLKYSRTGPVFELDSLGFKAIVMEDSVNKNIAHERKKEMEAYLFRFFDRRNLEPAGVPFEMQREVLNDTLVKLVVGIPIAERTWVWRTLKYMEVPAGRVISQIHFGRPENIGKSFHEISDYAKDNNLQQNGESWVIALYEQDTLLKDTSLFQTQVFYPVR